MESATLTRPAPGPDPPPAGPRRALVVATRRLSRPLVRWAPLVGFLVYPTYPNYDCYYSLLWGRELLHGATPFFEGFRAPTEHPLAIAFGALLSLARAIRRPRHGRR